MAQQMKHKAAAAHDITTAKADFPALHGKPVAYFDSASSAQKPEHVLNAMDNVARSHYANVHRGLYEFSQKTTALYEQVRPKVAGFLGVADTRQIIFTRNATEAINLVAYSWGRLHIKAGDEIILTALEHHANIVPWVRLAEEKQAILKIVPLKADGTIDIEIYESYLQSGKVRLAAFAHMSNVLGTILPVRAMVAAAQKHDVVTVVDGCQAAAQIAVNIDDIGCDFYVCSGHKLYGPTGVGILFGRYDILSAMPPFLGGGDMIEQVRFDGVTYKNPPHKFEAGTPAILEVIGLGAAIDYLQHWGMDNITAHERHIHDQIVEILAQYKNIRIFGPQDSTHKGAVISFDWQGVHPQDMATILDKAGVCLRVGHHCAQPLMDVLGVTATARLSVGLYNDMDDLARLQMALQKVEKLCL